MIYDLDQGFVISSNQVWIPGVYQDKKAARYAFQFSDSELQKLQDSKNGGVITSEDLKTLKQSLTASAP